MIRTAVEFLSDELNLYIKKKDAANFGNIETTVLSNLVAPDGSVAFDAKGDNNHKVILTLINIEQDRVSDSQSFYKMNDNNKIQYHNPPVNLNLYILFSVFSSDYKTALRLLSYVIAFFQATTVFDKQNFPHLNAKADAIKPNMTIERMVADLNTLGFEQQNNLWASLGAKYMPSVCYKVRTFTIVDVEPKMEAPPITEITIAD